MSKSFKHKYYLDSTGIVHKRKLLSDILNKSIAHFSAGAQTISTAEVAQAVEFTKSELISEGVEKFFLNNKGYVETKEDALVRITGNGQTYDASGTYMTIRIFKNSEQITSCRFSPRVSFQTEVIAPKYCKLTAGDTIHMEILGDSKSQQLNAIGILIEEV